MKAPEHRRLGLLWLELVLVAAVAATAFLCYRNPTIHTDEAFHLIAARSINAGQGLPDFGAGPYDRAWVFSHLVALATRLGGGGLAIARTPSLAAAVLLVVLVWLWTRTVADRLAAWLAAMLLALSIFTLDTAQFCRFYSLHALAVFAMAASLYQASQPGIPWRRRGAWEAAAIAAGGLALHLQASTVVVLLALAAWAALAVVCDPRITGRKRWARIGLVTIVAAAAVAVVLVSGFWPWAVARFRWQPQWMDPQHAGPAYYHRLMMTWYPLLWVFWPGAMVVAIAVYRRAAGFAVVLAAVGLLVMSLSSAQAPRYVFFIMPFFFIAWAMALSAVLRALHRRLTGALAVREVPPSRRRAAGAALVLVIATMLLYAAHRTPAYYLTERVLRTAHQPNAPFRRGDYAAALAAQSPDTLVSRHVLAAPAVKAAYYLPDRRVRLLGAPDYPTGVPTILDGDDLRRTLAKLETALIVVEDDYWRVERFVSDEMADAIEALARPLPVPPQARVRLFRWERAAAAQPDPAEATHNAADDPPAPPARG